MTSPSQPPTTWMRRRGALVAVTLTIVAIAAVVLGRRAGRLPGAHATAAPAASAAGDADDWLVQWGKDAFGQQDARKLWQQQSQAMRAELSKPGADPSDLTAKAGALGATPEKVFEFIRDQITLEPYAGVLRGARGTLAAGAGNALDRALLAKELLKVDGIESRVVAGKLSDAQTDTLLSRFFRSPQVPKVLADLLTTPNQAAVKEQAAVLSTKTGIPASAAASLADHVRDEAQSFWTQTEARNSIQFDSLESQLRRTSLTMAVDTRALTAMLKERLREHYWLQVREPNGRWSEFDPAFADAQRGTAHAPHAVPLAKVPDELYHKLEFSLVYQTNTNGEPKEETLVAASYPSAEALFQAIEFRIQPTELGNDAQALIAMDPKKRIETLRQLKRFQGLMVAGGKVAAGRKFDLQGNTYDPSSGPPLPVPAGTFADALGGAESAVQFVELRVVMRLTGPGREPMVQTRTLVRGPDLASPTFAPPIHDWEILLQPQWVPGDFVAFRALNQFLGVGDALIRASVGDRSFPNLRDPNAASPVLSEMALARESEVASILETRSGIRAFIDAPMLTIATHELSGINDSAQTITVTRRFDIVENGVTYVAASDTAGPSAFAAALKQGVADCTLEDRILRKNFPGTDTRSGTTIVEQANVEKRPVLLAKTQDIDALRSAGVTEDDINWIHDNELPDSRLVVATTANGSDAWWSIRPNGTAVLRTNGGRGQGALEKVILVEEIGLYALCAIDAIKLSYQAWHHEVEAETAIGTVLCMAGAGLGKLAKGALAGVHEGHLLGETMLVFWDTFIHFGVEYCPNGTTCTMPPIWNFFWH